MTGAPPTVSIAIRAYRRRWLGEAVASVLAQTYRDLELVIYDDAGDLADVVQAFDDPRLRYHRAVRKLEASGRFSAALALCHGRYLGLLDDDDRYEPEFVERLVAALEEDPGAGIAFCRTAWEIDGIRYEPPDPRPAGRQASAASDLLARRWSVTPSRMLMRRTALEDAVHARAMPDGVAPDIFVNVHVAVAGWSHVLVGPALAVCRWHDGQVSHSGPAHDLEIATWERLVLADPELDRLRARQLARALLARAVHRIRAGDAAGAREDLRAAARSSPTASRAKRRLLRLAAAGGPPGRLGVRAWLNSSGRDGAGPPGRP